MRNELIKQLKDAGFWKCNQTEEHRCSFAHCGNCGGCDTDELEIPTLEELIGACGEDFGSLYSGGQDDSFIADSNRDGIHSLENEGGTPVEAVAKLWLALNKK